MSLLRLSFTACIALYGLGACRVSPGGIVGSYSLPSTWKNSNPFPIASASRDLSRWWARFEDPALTRIIATALAANPDLASATARVKEARARRNAESASLFPSLSGSVASNTSSLQRDGQGSDSGTIFTTGLNSSWEVDLYGKNRSLIQAAAAQLGASEENFHSVQASLASDIAVAYTNLRVAESALSVLKRNVKTRSDTAELAAWRTQSGVTDSLEADQALASLEQARSAIPTLEQSIAQNRNLLALLSGQAPGALDALLNSNQINIPSPSSSLALGIPADVIRQRPDVRLAGYQLLAAAANSRAIATTRYPALNLNGSLGMNSPTLGKIFDPQTTAANIIVGLTGPIFDAGRIRSNIAAQNAVEERALQTYHGSILTALTEVENSLIACRRSTERLATLEKATAAARDAATVAQQRYQSGVTDLRTVLDTQRTQLSLEDNLFTTRAARTIAFIQLYRALGGGWS